jgi:hypothetical protein
MNTFDKASLFQLSFAFMRRFAFIDIDVPKQADYENLLTTYVSDPRKLGQDVAKPYWTGCLTALKNLLRQDGKDKDTLYELGLLVGPAIPLDMLKYLNQRMPSPDDADVTRFVLEALEMFLFPQFEGKDEEHPKIHDAVVNALGLKKADDLARTESRLRNWTGNEPDGV